MIRTGSVLAVCLLLLAAPCLAGAKIEKELALQPGGSFALDTDNGSVQVVGSDRNGARVVITSKRDDIESNYDIAFEENAGQVSVKVDRKGSGFFSWIGWGRGAGLRFEIEVPRETDINIDTSGGSISVERINGTTRLDTSGGSITVHAVEGVVSADTSGGSIEIEDVTGNVNVDTSGGHIDVKQVEGDVKADTSGGPIEISEVSGDVNADTSGGSISVIEAGSSVNADTSGGSVTVTFAAGNAAGGSLSTSGGSVRVGLDPSVGLEIDAETSGGRVNLDLPLTVEGELSKAAVRGKLGSGGALLRLRSSGGGIYISPR